MTTQLRSDSLHPCHHLSEPRKNMFWCRHCMKIFTDPIDRWRHSKMCREELQQCEEPSVLKQISLKEGTIFRFGVWDGDTAPSQPEDLYVKDTPKHGYCASGSGKVANNKSPVNNQSIDLKCVICQAPFASIDEMRNHVKTPCSKTPETYRFPSEINNVEQRKKRKVKSSLKNKFFQLETVTVQPTVAMEVDYDFAENTEPMLESETIMKTEPNNVLMANWDEIDGLAVDIPVLDKGESTDLGTATETSDLPSPSMTSDPNLHFTSTTTDPNVNSVSVTTDLNLYSTPLTTDDNLHSTPATTDLNPLSMSVATDDNLHSTPATTDLNPLSMSVATDDNLHSTPATTDLNPLSVSVATDDNLHSTDSNLRSPPMTTDSNLPLPAETADPNVPLPPTNIPDLTMLPVTTDTPLPPPSVATNPQCAQIVTLDGKIPSVEITKLEMSDIISNTSVKHTENLDLDEKSHFSLTQSPSKCSNSKNKDNDSKCTKQKLSKESKNKGFRKAQILSNQKKCLQNRTSKRKIQNKNLSSKKSMKNSELKDKKTAKINLLKDKESLKNGAPVTNDAKKETISKPPRPRKCGACDRMFKSLELLQRHNKVPCMVRLTRRVCTKVLRSRSQKSDKDQGNGFSRQNSSGQKPGVPKPVPKRKKKPVKPKLPHFRLNLNMPQYKLVYGDLTEKEQFFYKLSMIPVEKTLELPTIDTMGNFEAFIPSIANPPSDDEDHDDLSPDYLSDDEQIPPPQLEIISTVEEESPCLEDDLAGPPELDLMCALSNNNLCESQKPLWNQPSIDIPVLENKITENVKPKKAKKRYSILDPMCHQKPKRIKENTDQLPVASRVSQRLKKKALSKVTEDKGLKIDSTPAPGKVSVQPKEEKKKRVQPESSKEKGDKKTGSKVSKTKASQPKAEEKIVKKSSKKVSPDKKPNTTGTKQVKQRKEKPLKKSENKTIRKPVKHFNSTQNEDVVEKKSTATSCVPPIRLPLLGSRGTPRISTQSLALQNMMKIVTSENRNGMTKDDKKGENVNCINFTPKGANKKCAIQSPVVAPVQRPFVPKQPVEVQAAVVEKQHTQLKEHQTAVPVQIPHTSNVGHKDNFPGRNPQPRHIEQRLPIVASSRLRAVAPKPQPTASPQQQSPVIIKICESKATNGVSVTKIICPVIPAEVASQIAPLPNTARQIIPSEDLSFGNAASNCTPFETGPLNGVNEQSFEKVTVQYINQNDILPNYTSLPLVGEEETVELAEVLETPYDVVDGVNFSPQIDTIDPQFHTIQFC